MIGRALLAGLDRVRGSPLLHPAAVLEALAERPEGHPVAADHRPHLREAVAWLCRAQDATLNGGVARGYSLVWDSYFRSHGWQPPYPETTGYIIPTLLQAARHLNRPDFAARAVRAAQWEVAVQLSSGAVRAGAIGEPLAPAVFNTGQVLLGWLAAHAETGSPFFAAAARRAADFLARTLEADDLWHAHNSPNADPHATLYNARAAWALAEAGRRLEEPGATAAAVRNLRAVRELQHDSGWIPQCCLTDPARPLLHTLAYAVRGLLEGGRVLEDERLIAGAELAAGRIAEAVGPDGRLPGRFAADWRPAATWSCLTGEAQMANIWLRLHAVTGQAKWLEPVPAVLRFLKSTQNRTSRNPGLRGGIKGSFPLGAEYGRYQTLSWATKFFADALMRHERLGSGASVGPATVEVLS